ncbi:hypothetical protein [Mycoplasmopsis bovis]|uniref:hypothetical protein n=1 Tax=Mycoplasmopsis bovis TaxID=28903 RepID=UPI003D28E12B
MRFMLVALCEILDAKRLEEIKPTDENVKELHLPNVSNLEEAKSYAKEILTVKKYSEIHRQVIDSLILHGLKVSL